MVGEDLHGGAVGTDPAGVENQRPGAQLLDQVQVVGGDQLGVGEVLQQADQQSQQMQFVLQRERQEADRKRIEAQGVADFQRIVSSGISDQLLQWKGIEATEKLVNSPNAKVVVIGNPKNGLPLILGGQ